MARRKGLAQIEKLADEIGTFIVHWGFKKVHGRIWTHLTVSNHPLDASELMAKMGISKALASMSLNELLRMKVIESAGKSSKGTQLYRTNPNVLAVIMSVLKFREREMLARIHQAAKMVKRLPLQQHRDHELNSENIDRLYELMGTTVSALELFMRNLRFDLSAIRSLNLAQPNKLKN